MNHLILKLEAEYKKPTIVMVRSGDTVKVTQRITEGSRQRLQVFEGLVIRVDRKNSLTYRILVRKMSGSIGVEKSFLMHSPHVIKVEVLKRSKVRRNYLSYMRQRVGKAARLKSINFNKQKVNQGVKTDKPVVKEETSSDKTKSKTDETKPVKATDEKPVTKDDQTPKESAQPTLDNQKTNKDIVVDEKSTDAKPDNPKTKSE